VLGDERLVNPAAGELQAVRDGAKKFFDGGKFHVMIIAAGFNADALSLTLNPSPAGRGRQQLAAFWFAK
jgi:hypothetical protein